jgi:uncharacterized membrane protein YphA (DoxX/SURF4 family)
MTMTLLSSLYRLRNRHTVTFILRCFIGSLFIYASLHKITNPIDFALIVADFEVLPHWSINSVAVFLPWLEFWAGTFLLLGIMVRSNAILLTALLCLFCWFTLLHFLIGSHITCGCFSNDGTPSITAWTIARNVMLMIGTVAIAVLERRSFSFR